MKKLLFLVLALFISTNVFARCGRFDKTKCPTAICPSGTFMGDDGQCYACDTEKKLISVDCIGYEKAFELCPNRFFHLACKTYSVLKCFDEALVEKAIEINNKDYEIEVYIHQENMKPYRQWINYTTHRCKNPDRRY